MGKKTRKDGTFTLTLPPGPYLLLFMSAGEIRNVEKEVQVESGKETVLNVELTRE